MSRARNIKPSFFTNDALAECEPLARLLFVGIWTLADREGRLEDRPKKIKAELLPYDDCNADKLLNELETNQFILRYEVADKKYIQIKSFNKHQNPHHMEVPSEIPPADGYSDKYSHSPIGVPQRRRIYERDKHKCKICHSKKNLHIDHIMPVSKGGNSEDINLRTLCGNCNLSKSNNDDISITRRIAIDNEMRSSKDHHDKHALHPTDSLNLIPDSFTLKEEGVSFNSSKKYISAFDMAGCSVYGEQYWEGIRPWAKPKDITTDSQIAALGSTPEEFKIYCEFSMNCMKERGQEIVTTLAYYVPGFTKHIQGITTAASLPKETEEERLYYENLDARMDEIRKKSQEHKGGTA